jgi:hypothetical protein
MSKVTSTVLKTYFQTGDFPTQTQFESFIDSSVVNYVSALFPIGSVDLTQASNPNMTQLLLMVGYGTTALDFSSNALLESIMMYGNYTTLASCNCLNMTALKQFVLPFSTCFTTLNFSGCTALKYLYLVNNSVNASLNLTGCAALIRLDCGNNTLLVSPTITTLASALWVSFMNDALNTAAVDNILALCNANGLSNGFLYLNGGTNAAPTGGGANPNYLALIGKGWTITKN